MATKILKDFLENNNIEYTSIHHLELFTAQEIAASAHIPGKELAKTVMVKIDGKMAMAVIPASEKVDVNLLKKATGAEEVKLAGEKEFEKMFPDCEIGAMPPFGNLYKMDVYVEEHLTDDKEIAFNAGTHTELLKLAYKDFERLVKPRIAQFSYKNPHCQI
jgi:Ala-tRNA(Pro) deacylase